MRHTVAQASPCVGGDPGMVMLADASGRAGLDLPSTVPEAPDTPFATASDDAISIDARPESAGMPMISTGPRVQDIWARTWDMAEQGACLHCGCLSIPSHWPKHAGICYSLWTDFLHPSLMLGCMQGMLQPCRLPRQPRQTCPPSAPRRCTFPCRTPRKASSPPTICGLPALHAQHLQGPFQASRGRAAHPGHCRGQQARPMCCQVASMLQAALPTTCGACSGRLLPGP